MTLRTEELGRIQANFQTTILLTGYPKQNDSTNLSGPPSLRGIKAVTEPATSRLSYFERPRARNNDCLWKPKLSARLGMSLGHSILLTSEAEGSSLKETRMTAAIVSTAAGRALKQVSPLIQLLLDRLRFSTRRR